MKKIALTLAALFLMLQVTVCAEKNRYNEMDYINISNTTLNDIAELQGVTFEELKEMLNLPEDMTGDTNEEAAYNSLSLEAVAAIGELSLDEILSMAKGIYAGDKEVSLSMTYGEFESGIPLGKYNESVPFEEIKKAYGFDDSVTEDTLYGDVSIQIHRQELKNNNVLSYDAGSGILVMLKGKYLDFDVEPIIINDRVMVPMRNIFEAMGASVNWVGDSQTIFAKTDSNIITMQIGQQNIFKNETKIEFDTAPMIVNERTLVPIRAVAEALDTEVFYNQNTRTVVIH